MAIMSSRCTSRVASGRCWATQKSGVEEGASRAPAYSYISYIGRQPFYLLNQQLLAPTSTSHGPSCLWCTVLSLNLKAPHDHVRLARPLSPVVTAAAWSPVRTMLCPALPVFSVSRWLSSIAQRFAHLFRRLLRYLAPSWLPEPSRQVDIERPELYPPTTAQIDASTKQFIDSISRQSVCHLVSRHTGGQTCSVIEDKLAYGSFNVCFFVRLDSDASERIVRIPMGPVVVSAWEKLQSEVATIRYTNPDHICLRLRLFLTCRQ